MTTTHTPGPWHVTPTGPAAMYLRIDGPQDEMIAAIFLDRSRDARLIAAAPDLLHALELIAKAASGRVPMLNDWVHKIAISSIARATE